MTGTCGWKARFGTCVHTVFGDFDPVREHLLAMFSDRKKRLYRGYTHAKNWSVPISFAYQILKRRNFRITPQVGFSGHSARGCKCMKNLIPNLDLALNFGPDRLFSSRHVAPSVKSNTAQHACQHARAACDLPAVF